MTSRETPSRWTAADVRRAVKALEKAGKPVAAVDFPHSGGFRLLIGESSSFDLSGPNGPSEWDDVLPR